jgi:hypothetical protein
MKRSKVWISYCPDLKNINSEPLTVKFEFDYDYDCYFVSIYKERLLLKETPVNKQSDYLEFEELKKSIKVADNLIQELHYKETLLKKLFRKLKNKLNDWIYNQCGMN